MILLNDDNVLRPPDERFEYTSAIFRIAGAAVDVIFLHIILIPLRVPAVDFSFKSGHVGPAAIFLVIYFGFLGSLLCLKGLTPGGLALGYRVVDKGMKWLRPARALLRLSPYIMIQFVALWRLQIVINDFEASGEAFHLDKVTTLIKEHGGFLNTLVLMLNFFVVIDIARILPSSRNQALVDSLAESFVVSPKAA